MSVDLIRNIEVHRPDIKGEFNKEDFLDTVKDPQEDDTYRSYVRKDGRYFMWKDGKWNASWECPRKKWVALQLYSQDPDLRGREDTIVASDAEGNVVKNGTILSRVSGFSDNGGVIRDKYLSSSTLLGRDGEFSDRGWPSDMSDIMRNILDDCKNDTWGHTYVSLSEWSLKAKECKESFKKDLLNYFKKRSDNITQLKLDNVLSILSKGSDETISDINKRFKKKLKKAEESKDDVKFYDDEYRSVDEYETPLDYMMEEGLSEYYSIIGEIRKAYDLVEAQFGWVSNEDVRIIYFMC